MDAEDDVDVIMSDLCAEVEVDGCILTVEIYKTDIDPGWILEVINEFGTSIVFDDPFIADGLAWKRFEQTLNDDGITAFYSKSERRRLFH